VQVEVGRLEDFEPGIFRIVTVAGRELGILRWGEELFAVRNVCPHLGGPVCAGTVAPELRAEAGGTSLQLDSSRPTLSCAWHRWEFDLRGGRMLVDPSMRLKTYQVSCDSEGRVMVELPARDQQTSESAGSSPVSR
jgi:nitrite reductase/ring-hydroxylating ferredoxin subunit